MMKIILGSSSKWRQQILREMGFDFEVMNPDIDEKAIRHDDPQKLVLAIAAAKAEVLLPRITEPAILITSDQVAVCNGQIREKPESEDEARLFLESYADHPSEAVTGVVVINIATGKRCEGVDVAKLYFRPIPSAVIDELVKDEDIMACCGAFMLEHELLKPFELRIEGERESIEGLPATLTKRLIEQVQR